VALHPRFAENRTLYLAHAAGTEAANRTVLTRARLEGERLAEVQTIFSASPDKTRGAHFGSRLLWAEDGSLLMSVGDGGNPAVQLAGRPIREQAQNLDAHLGKVLRLDENGRPPADNPFLNRPGIRPEIWSFGHRNIQGMAWDPTRRMLFATEHGSRAGDELNRLRRGLNYGWPVATHSEEYTGGPISPHRAQPGLEDPLLVWMTTVAPSGLAAHSGRGVAAWRGDLFAGGLRSQDVRRVRLDAEGRVTGEERIPVGRRVRDVREGPDGRLYLLTDETNGRLMRVEPA
jgi:aldose sugar dehydrogenase